MKKAFLALSLSLFLSTSFVLPVAAQTPTSGTKLTPTVAPTKKMQSDSLTAEITNLKDKIASRVAEMKLVEKRGIIGVVTEVKDSAITVTDSKGNTRFVDVDELTKFIGADDKDSLGISDIKKGMTIAVLGRYNKQTERILARFVQSVSFPQFFTGSIKDVDSTNFAFSVTSTKGKLIDIDVENVTKTQTYSKEDGLTRAGFSKLQVGDQVVVTGFPDKTNPKRIVATRILILTDFRKADVTETPHSPTTATTKTATPTP